MEDSRKSLSSVEKLVLATNQVKAGSGISLAAVFQSSIQFVLSHKLVLGLIAVAFATRLPLLSISLDEVDSANFHNALVYGYNINQFRPHPPGYPIYIFMAWTLKAIVGDALLSLTLVSAILGSLAAIPFYLLLRDMLGRGMAVLGTLLFLVNPLIWSVSESALSDAPSMFFAVMVAWLSYKGRHSNAAFLLAVIASSLAIGVRQPNAALLILPAFSLAYRLFVTRNLSWRLPLAGASLFTITTLAWFIPAAYIGSGGFDEYFEVTSWMYGTSVKIFDFTEVESPWFLNVLIRMERFFFGYFLTYAWTGGDSRTPLTILSVIPWLFGISLFLIGFRIRDPRHIFVLLWMGSLIYTVMMIHFLPRYALPQLPASIVAILFGFRFLGQELMRHPRRFEILSMLGIGSVIILFGIKNQPPVATFEHTPPDGSLVGAVFVALGLALFAVAGILFRTKQVSQESDESQGSTRAIWGKVHYTTAVSLALGLLIALYAVNGYAVSSIAHNQSSPNHRLTQYVKVNFDPSQVAACWDRETHSFFDAVTPEVNPIGFWSADELYREYRSGKTVLVSDRCPRFDDLNRRIGLNELASFSGSSPLWAKTPSITLYATPKLDAGVGGDDR